MFFYEEIMKRINYLILNGFDYLAGLKIFVTEP